MKDKSTIRKEIDLIDEQIIALLNKRFQTAVEIGEFKKANGMPITDEKREEKVLQSVENSFNNVDFSKAGVAIYKEIIKQCSELQK